MAPASHITPTTTLLRQSVVVSPSNRFRGGLSREPTWVVVHQNLAAVRNRHDFIPLTNHIRLCRYVSPSRRKIGALQAIAIHSFDGREGKTLNESRLDRKS